MSSQLDILALEPFYGGARRHMLETVLRCSRHRWTLLKLPPRRMDRRLAVAASWFAEQLSRHWSGRVDILFTSEAMNLSALYRLAPNLARTPSVVYFHENQMEVVAAARSQAAGRSNDHRLAHGSSLRGGQPAVLDNQPEANLDLDLVNLTTAAAATEVWFNSAYHQRTFMAQAARTVQRHASFQNRNPLAGITAKARVAPPPTDLNLIPLVRSQLQPNPPDSRAIFVDTRNGQLGLLNGALGELTARGERFRLVTVGPIDELSDQWPRRTVRETDDLQCAAGLLECGVVLSIRPGAACDLHAIRGLQAGCRPLFPTDGVYANLLPPSMHAECLYTPSIEALVARLQSALNAPSPWSAPEDVRPLLKPFEAIAATRVFDERLSQLAQSHSTPAAPKPPTPAAPSTPPAAN